MGVAGDEAGQNAGRRAGQSAVREAGQNAGRRAGQNAGREAGQKQDAGREAGQNASSRDAGKMQVVKQERGGSEDVLSVLTNSEAGSTQDEDPTTILTAGNKVLAWPYKSSNQLSSRLIAKGAKSSINFKSTSSASNKAPSASRLMVARKNRVKNSTKTNSTQKSGRARTLRAHKAKRTRAHARQCLESEAKQAEAAAKQAARRSSALRNGTVKRTSSRAHLPRKAASSRQVLNIQRGSAAFGSAALLWVQQVQGPQRVFVLGLQQGAQHDAPARSLAIDSQAETAGISTSITNSEEHNARTNSPRLRGSLIFRRNDTQAKSPSLRDEGSKVEMENDKSSKVNDIKPPNLRGSAVFLQEEPPCGKGSSFCGCASDELESVQMLSTANPREKAALRELCQFEKYSLRKKWDSMTRWLGLSEGACVKSLAVGAYVLRYNGVNWLTSYTPETQAVDFHALPEEYTDVIESKAGPVQWSHILDEYKRLLALSKSSKSTKPVVKPLPPMYSARNGLRVAFSLGLTMKIPNMLQKFCEDVAQNGGNSKAFMTRPILWLLRRSSKSKSGVTSKQLQESCSLLLPKVRDLIAEGAQTVAQRSAVLFFPTGAADSRRIYARLTSGALNDFNEGKRGTTEVGGDDEATVTGLSKTEMAIQQDMKAQTPHLVNTAVSEDGSSASSPCCEHCGVAGVYDRLARLFFQSDASTWYRSQATSSFIATSSALSATQVEGGESTLQAVEALAPTLREDDGDPWTWRDSVELAGLILFYVTFFVGGPTALFLYLFR